MIPKTTTVFSVHGDAPVLVTQLELDILADNAFKSQSIGVPQRIENGFVTGEHIYDIDFTYEKNGFDSVLLFALRIDTHNVPSNIKLAYKRMHEKAVVSQKEDSLGFLSKQEKREATELTNRQIQEELAAGKYRKSTVIPVLWDLYRRQIIFGTSSISAVDQLHKIMRESFNIELDQLPAGATARRLDNMQITGDAFNDLRPTGFTEGPHEAVDTAELTDDLSIPFVPWVLSSVDPKDFLGNEFLLWLWWMCETHEGMVEINNPDRHCKDRIGVVFDKSLQMECAWGVGGRQVLTSDGPTRLKEASEALSTGKWPRKAGLIIADLDSSEQWTLTLQADLMVAGGIKLPSTKEVQSPRELIEYQITSLRRIRTILFGLLVKFLDTRMSPEWDVTKDEMSGWIKKRHEAVSQTATV
ncbi:MAG: hypothetical protein JKX85_06260 [Phycisphaeraceae bacterium]|nr:hypothetical protein [Phycisphaeraceae bacterium]